MDAILARGEGDFDAEWMQQTFDIFWKDAQWSVSFTNALLSPTDVMSKMMGAASQFPTLARRIGNGVNNPRDMFPWFVEEAAAEAYLVKLSTAA